MQQVKLLIIIDFRLKYCTSATVLFLFNKDPNDSVNSVKSPPWLLAAEKRLQQQNTSSPQTTSNSDRNTQPSVCSTNNLVISENSELSRENKTPTSCHLQATRDVPVSEIGDKLVECPLCADFYPNYLIEMHASACSIQIVLPRFHFQDLMQSQV